MIKVICVGKIKEKFFRDALEEYVKRISKFERLNIYEVSDEKNIDKALFVEGKQVLKYIKSNDYVIGLDIFGNELSSEEFAFKIGNNFGTNKNLTFVIGGSYGLAEVVKSRCDYLLSFSKMTFPHQLFRVVFLEQLYRSYKIINNESYHK